MFYRENKKIMDIPVNPSLTIYMWSVRGLTLHGHVSMMLKVIKCGIYYDWYAWATGLHNVTL